METFGFSVTESGDDILIDGNLDISLFLQSQFGEGDSEGNFTEFTLNQLLDIEAPDGTAISNTLSGGVRVDRGGPLSYSLTRTVDDESPMVDSITISAGQCAEPDDEDVYQLVACTE